MQTQLPLSYVVVTGAYAFMGRLRVSLKRLLFPSYRFENYFEAVLQEPAQSGGKFFYIVFK